MSFSKSPYIHMGIVTRDGGCIFLWECDSCGAEHGYFRDSATIAEIRSDFLDHIRTSHARTEADFEGWA